MLPCSAVFWWGVNTQTNTGQDLIITLDCDSEGLFTCARARAHAHTQVKCVHATWWQGSLRLGYHGNCVFLASVVLTRVLTYFFLELNVFACVFACLRVCLCFKWPGNVMQYHLENWGACRDGVCLCACVSDEPHTSGGITYSLKH